MDRVPDWVLSVVCMAAILWLTLAPQPLGDTDVMLFPGFDKVAHGLMFFGLTLCMMFDDTRSRGWKPLGLMAIIVITAIGMAAGIGIEFLQREMHMGRGFEVMDILSDCIGAISGAAVWSVLGDRFCNPG